MVAVLAMHVHFLSPPSPPVSSSISSTALNCPTTVQSSLAPVSLNGWLSIEKITRNPERNPLLPLMGLRSSSHLLLTCTKNSTNIYTDTGIMLFSLFQEIGIEEKGARILMKNNPGLIFMPFESIRARVESLQVLGINGLALSRIIAKRPDLLTAEEIGALIHFVGNLEGKVELSQLQRLFNTIEPRFLLGFEAKVRLLIHHGIPLERLAYVLNNIKLDKALCLKSLEEIERTLIFLNRFGGVDLILRRPAILDYDMDSQLVPRIGFLLELSGGDEDATAKVLHKLPFILAYTVEHLEDHVKFMRLFAGLSDEEIFRIVSVYPNLFSASRKRKLHPRIDFLKQCSLSPDDIFKFLIKAPLFVGLSFEDNLAHKLVFLVKIGYENRTKELAMAMGAVTRTSYKNMQEVISLFLNYGLTCEDILAMAKKHPQILQYNHDSLERKMDYLIEDMGREVGELLAFPAFLGYQLDGRIKHRYEVTKKILGKGMSLNKLLTVSAARFSMKKDKKKYTVK